MVRYEKFDLKYNAELAMNYMTGMVDPAKDNLPYWLVLPHAEPAYAKHCRVDDAELVASWYEGVVSLRHVLNTEDGRAVEDSFRRHLLNSWGEGGLRYHKQYPWTHTNHSSFHEMGYVLSALNRCLAVNPLDRQIEERAAALVKGLRDLVIERKVKTFWSGDFYEEDPVYEFPNDVFLTDGGFDLSRHTGRGEKAIRNSVLILPLVTRWEMTGEERAKDLAVGLINHLLGVSRYFNYKMEFFGHVHSAIWAAAGIIRLGRLTDNSHYVDSGKRAYDYVLSLSSSFGWVPEYAQWHPAEEEHCETCCIKDMIECGLELVNAGYPEYYDVVNRFTRNQLIENQIKDGSFVSVDNTLTSTDEYMYQAIDKKIVGGFSGGSEPNAISLTRFRSIAGCCVGTAPQAMEMYWSSSVEALDNQLLVHMPCDRKEDKYTIETGYPNDGYINITTTYPCDIFVRYYDWMESELTVSVDGEPHPFYIVDGYIKINGFTQGQRLVIGHTLDTVVTKEIVRGTVYTIYWRGSDVVDMSPKGDHIRLYQRILGADKYYPKPEDIQVENAGVIASPTQQKK